MLTEKLITIIWYGINLYYYYIINAMFSWTIIIITVILIVK